MNKILQSFAIIVIVLAVSIAIFSAYDTYNLSRMKTAAVECGFETDENFQVCECDGKMTSSADTLNPSLAENIGGLNFYCYGECHSCRCYDAEGNEIDCEQILEQESIAEPDTEADADSE